MKLKLAVSFSVNLLQKSLKYSDYIFCIKMPAAKTITLRGR